MMKEDAPNNCLGHSRLVMVKIGGLTKGRGHLGDFLNYDAHWMLLGT